MALKNDHIKHNTMDIKNSIHLLNVRSTGHRKKKLDSCIIVLNVRCVSLQCLIYEFYSYSETIPFMTLLILVSIHLMITSC